MKMFGKNKEEFKDLKPEHRRKRKEPTLSWGKKERAFILVIFLGTVLVSGLLALSAGNYKFSGLAKISFPKLSLNGLFKGETIVIGNRETPADKIIKAFKDQTKDLTGTYAFEIVDLSTGASFGVNESQVMQAASLIKLPLMLYAQGKVSDVKIEAMGKRSDNAVFEELVAKFGQKTVQSYIDSLGMEETSLAENTTTAKEIGNLFYKIYKDKQSLASEAGKEDKILGYLTDTIFEKWLRAGIPEEIRVAHKYGREVGVVNDAGIIFSDQPFVLVIMSQGVNEEEADKVVPELARMIYLEYAESQNIR